MNYEFSLKKTNLQLVILIHFAILQIYFMKKIIQLSFIFLSFCFWSNDVIAQDAITIAQAREIDSEGALVRLNQNVELTGIAIGPNFRSGGQTWVLFSEADNIGITVFAFNNDVMYDVTDGDELKVIGDLAEFNGLAEIIPTSIEILSSGNAIPAPNIITELRELNEASLVTIENVSLVDESEWGSGSFNVNVTDGTNTFQVRIDSDIDISGMPAPQGTFNVTGIVGQFDNEAPYFQGYQVFPRSTADINPYDTGSTGGPVYEKLSIEQARETDGDFASTRVGDLVEITGIVHGINFRPSGLQFSVIDDNNNGIGLFSSSDDLGYTFKESDEITVWGRIAQFNGLTQINPDSIDVISTNNILQIGIQKMNLDESTESSVTSMTMAGWVDPSQWAGDGSSFNVDFNTPQGEVIRIRIDSDSPLSTASIPDGFSIVTGIGGQFDNEAPFDGGYQLFPYSLNAFEPYLSTENVYVGNVEIFPNPTTNIVTIKGDEFYDRAEIFNISGQRVMDIRTYSGNIDMSNLANGVYTAKFYFNESVYTDRIVKM